MTKPARKPFRRTAWSLLIGGLAGVALVFGGSAYAVGTGEPAGPGQAATWPAGTEIAVYRPIGPNRNYLDDVNAVCTVTPQSDQPTKRLLAWGQRIQPDFAGSATITCEKPARVLNDPLLTIANVTRGSLFAWPILNQVNRAPFAVVGAGPATDPVRCRSWPHRTTSSLAWPRWKPRCAS